uniref:Uncharacterized protein n=1 Tax=Gloeothece verrucosa (strain PCC 7822) TaxID=497965 RepID=E0UBD9_GLOV7|nr:hypothetical protein Cyan7822_0742 [Gloeothece verrucosa PCC 7822]
MSVLKITHVTAFEKSLTHSITDSNFAQVIITKWGKELKLTP